MAIAPQIRLALAKVVGSRSKRSIIERQVVPPSDERKTPPFAEAAYTTPPPGATASRATRPPTGCLPTVCPFMTTLGPSGTQFRAPGTNAVVARLPIGIAAGAAR